MNQFGSERYNWLFYDSAESLADLQNIDFSLELLESINIFKQSSIDNAIEINVMGKSIELNCPKLEKLK